jgi:hypothetical protein
MLPMLQVLPTLPPKLWLLHTASSLAQACSWKHAANGDNAWQTQELGKTSKPTSPPHKKTIKICNSLLGKLATNLPAASQEQTHSFYMMPITITSQIHSNQTGPAAAANTSWSFTTMIPTPSSPTALTSQTKSELLQAYSKLHDHLPACRLKHVLQCLDNKAPGRL